jgi:glycerate dehydrogenase
MLAWQTSLNKIKLKLVFLDTATVGDIPNMYLLGEFGEVNYYKTTAPEQTLERVKDAEVIITNKVLLSRNIIEQLSVLKLICIAATGTNNIDKDAAAERGIVVKSVADYSTNSVAQGTFALLLSLLNHITYFDKYVKEGNYSQSRIFTHFGRTFWELSGKRFGIIGMGNIGRKVASIAQTFGCEVVYYSTSGKNNSQPFLRLELAEFLQTSDIVSIHAPLNEFTANLINYDRLSSMKRSAILINAGRGGIVQESDLVRALNGDLIAGAGIDVYEQEPIRKDHPFMDIINHEKIVLSPHVTWASIQARTLLMEKVAQNIKEFLKEKE